MRRNWPFFKDSDWLILVFVHSAKPTAELQNLAMSPSLSSPGLSYDTKFVHIGWELRSSLVGDTILGVQSEPACRGKQNPAGDAFEMEKGNDYVRDYNIRTAAAVVLWSRLVRVASRWW